MNWILLFQQICIPRLAGTPNCASVVDTLAAELRNQQYDVHLEPFTAGPERLVGGSLLGLFAAIGSLILTVGILVVPVSATACRVLLLCAAFAVLIGLFAAIVSLISTGRLHAPWLGTLLGFKVPDPPWADTANLCAVKDRHPKVWLVAHSDSKVQNSSLWTRRIAARMLLWGVLALTGLAVMKFTCGCWGGWAIALTVIVGLLAIFGGGILAGAGLKDGSPGAIDNATGVIAVLAAAERLEWRPDVGILITGAEEFAMAGAREWVKGGWSGNLFVNVDGLDSRGDYYLWTHNGEEPGAARWMTEALRAELATPEIKVHLPSWLRKLALFLDGMIFSKAGMAGVTIQRGYGETLKVAHTAKDTPDRVDVDGSAVRAGRSIAPVVSELLARMP